jgi:glycosyltransferase involved in cell wall biosynthesis
MRILYVIDSLKIGGAEMLLVDMVRAYTQQGHEVSVAYFTHGELYDDVRAMGIPIHRLSERGLKDPGVMPRLLRLIRAGQPEVVHTHLSKSDASGQIGAALAKTPVRVSTIHNVNPWRSSRFFSLLMRQATAGCQRHIAVSSEVRDYTVQWSKYPAEKMVVIENGINLGRFDPATALPLDKMALWGVPPDAPTVGIIGRLEAQKGHHILLRAAQLVAEEMPEARIIVIGSGPLREDLQALSADLGVDDKVVFAGSLRDMPRAFATLDIVTFSSLWEGLPVALLEAMAMERPVVATTVGGIPDVIDDGRNGLLVAPDDAGALTDGLLRVLGDEGLAKRLGAEARRTIQQRFSDEVMHERIMDLYQSLLKQAQSTDHPANPL